MSVARVVPRIWRILPLACLAFVVPITPLLAADLPSDAEIKSILKNYIERDHWGVGVVVGIVDEHGTRIVSYGKQGHGDSPEVNGDTLFEIGSITKRVYHRDGAELFAHGGMTGGQKTFLGFDKKLKRGVVVLANRFDPLT